MPSSPITTSMIADLIAGHDQNRPRSKQRAIGPSQIGGPCPRRLGYQIAGVPEVNQCGLNLAPWIGTAAHEQMAKVLEAHPDWRSEMVVTIPDTEHLSGTGQPIRGTADAYHAPSKTVVDWKFTADSTINNTRLRGEPDLAYSTQVQLYAYGLTRTGVPVNDVAVVFLPRSGNPRQMHVWTAPYDEQIAQAALERLASIRLLAEQGMFAELPTAQYFCESCPWYLPASTRLDEACPGHPRTNHTSGWNSK